DHGTGFSGGGTSHEEPVLGAKLAGADRLLCQVVVDTRLAVLDVGDQLAPLVSGVADRVGHGAFGQMAVSLDLEKLFEFEQDGLGLFLSSQHPKARILGKVAL